MNLFIIAIGVLCIIVGAYIWRLAEKTPEDELVPWGWGAWRSHGLAYVQAFLALLVGVWVIIMGVIW